MRTLAQILTQAGHFVCGADVNHSRMASTRSPGTPGGDELVSRLVARWLEWEDEHPDVEVDVCVASPAVPESAPLYRWAVTQGVPVMKLPAAVGSVFAGRSQVCVAGTHGKSTTSALLAWMLNSSGYDAGVYVGAELAAGGAGSAAAEDGAASSGKFGRGPLAILEACEFDRSFLELSPQHVILNGIDGDHFDCFADESDEDAAYQRFLELLPSDGSLLMKATCDRSRQAAVRAGVRATGWALEQSASNWCGRIVETVSSQMTVRVERAGKKFGDICVPLTGRHNAENLLAAVAMSSRLGLSAAQCRAAAADFPGVRRRLEDRGSCRGMRLLDDYAHHPTAVTTALQTVRQRFAGCRIRVLFEPHQVLRVQRCEDQFTAALSLADDILVLPVFPAREQVSEATCHRISQQLAATISAQGTPAVFAENRDAAVSIVELTGRPDDVVVTMGAGTVHQIHDEVLRRFQRDSAA